jgi:hypothetical protein
MRFVFAAAMIGAVAVVSPAQAARSNAFSWGKAGVSLADYARDATECAETSRYLTAYIPPKTLRQLDALSAAQLLDTVMQIGGSAGLNAMNVVDAVTKLRSADDIARRTNTFGAKYVAIVSLDVRDQLQAVLDRCLSERGYHRIMLTDSQARTLRSLKRHSPTRTAYLYSLDSDASIIERQRVRTDDQTR